MIGIVGGPNIQVTSDGDPNNDRSESFLAVSSIDARHMVGASKKFFDPATYSFTLATYSTFNAGSTWSDTTPALAPGWGGMTDPVTAFDGQGNAYLLAQPFQPSTDPKNATGPTVGIAVYRSTDGIHWSEPNLIHSGPDDKQAMMADRTPTSPYYGRIYASWDDYSTDPVSLDFARSLDNGQSWIGAGSTPPGTAIATAGVYSDIAITEDGVVNIVRIWRGQITLIQSTDGGETFTSPVPIVQGLTGLPLQLPGGSFRVESIPVVCAGREGNLVVAWADFREGVARIYYRHSADGGATWAGPDSGQPMLTGSATPPANHHDFHPQLAVGEYGAIGCAFYEFGPTPTQNLVNVMMTVSGDDGVSFGATLTVTDHPWDPTIDAPSVHGDPITFIGDYFGLAGSQLGFFPFWTDTRTGVQEIFTAHVSILNIACNFTALAAGTSLSREIGPLQEFRDETMLKTPAGRRLVQLLDEHGSEAMALIKSDNNLYQRVMASLQELVPVITGGQSQASSRLEGELVDELEEVMGQVGKGGSAGLKRAIDEAHEILQRLRGQTAAAGLEMASSLKSSV